MLHPSKRCFGPLLRGLAALALVGLGSSAFAQLAPGTTIRVIPPDGLVIDAGGTILGGSVEVRGPQGQPLPNVQLTRTRINADGQAQGTAPGLFTDANGQFLQGFLSWGNDTASLRGGANRYCLVNVPPAEAALACVDVTVLGNVITTLQGRKLYTVGGGTTVAQATRANAVAAAAAVRAQLSNVQSRLRTLRQGTQVGWVNDTTVQINGRVIPLSGAGSDNGGSGSGSGSGSGASASTAGRSDNAPAAARTSGWGAYLMGTVSVQELKGSNALKVGTDGVSIGADYRFSRRAALGAALGYAKSSTDFSSLADAQRMTATSLTVYGSFEPAPQWYIDAALSHARNDFKLSRLLAPGSFARADTQGSGTGLGLTGGYQWIRGSMIVSPYLRVDALRVSVDGYTETGEAPFRLGDQRLSSTSVTLGSEWQYAIATQSAILMPHARLELQRQTQDNARAINAQLVGSSAQLLVDPPLEVDRTWGLLSVGLSAQFRRGLSAFADYETLVGKSQTSERRLNLGVKLEF